MKTKGNPVILAVGIGLLLTMAVVAIGAGFNYFAGHLDDQPGLLVLVISLITLFVLFVLFPAAFLLRMRVQDRLAFVICSIPAFFFFLLDYFENVRIWRERDPGVLLDIGGYVRPFDLFGNLYDFLHYQLWALVPAIVAISVKRMIRKEPLFGIRPGTMTGGK